MMTFDFPTIDEIGFDMDGQCCSDGCNETETL